MKRSDLTHEKNNIIKAILKYLKAVPNRFSWKGYCEMHDTAGTSHNKFYTSTGRTTYWKR